MSKRKKIKPCEAREELTELMELVITDPPIYGYAIKLGLSEEIAEKLQDYVFEYYLLDSREKKRTQIEKQFMRLHEFIVDTTSLAEAVHSALERLSDDLDIDGY